MTQLRVSTPDELIAAVPHLLGFHPENSMVVVPVTAGLPVARVDLPSDGASRTEVVNSLVGVYGRAGSGEVMLVGFAEGWNDVELAGVQLRSRLDEAGVQVIGRLWAGEQRWTDLDTGDSGARTAGAASKLDTAIVVGGHRLPAASREVVERSFTGDPAAVTRYLPMVLHDLENSTPARERQWAIGRAGAFLDDGRRLSDPQAARMIACLQAVTIRDAMTARISCETAPSWQPLWEDLTRRSPDELVAPAAMLSALSSWCAGDGARAWSALDRIPANERDSYPLAVMVATSLHGGVNPREWDKVRASVLDDQPPASADIIAVTTSPAQPPTVTKPQPPPGPAR